MKLQFRWKKDGILETPHPRGDWEEWTDGSDSLSAPRYPFNPLIIVVVSILASANMRSTQYYVLATSQLLLVRILPGIQTTR